MTEYVVNNRTGEVHESTCPRVKVIASKSVWDPAKAALTPGVFADKTCMSGQLPLRTVAVLRPAVTIALGEVDGDGLTAPEHAIAAALYARWPNSTGEPALLIRDEDPRTVAQVAWRAVMGA